MYIIRNVKEKEEKHVIDDLSLKLSNTPKNQQFLSQVGQLREFTPQGVFGEERFHRIPIIENGPISPKSTERLDINHLPSSDSQNQTVNITDNLLNLYSYFDRLTILIDFRIDRFFVLLQKIYLYTQGLIGKDFTRYPNT